MPNYKYNGKSTLGTFVRSHVQEDCFYTATIFDRQSIYSCQPRNALKKKCEIAWKRER